jgi:hypothetical protein
VDGTVLECCPVASFVISSVELSRSTNKDLDAALTKLFSYSMNP